MSALPLAQRGRVFTAILTYAQTREVFDERYFRNQLAYIVYLVILRQVERDRMKYDELCALNQRKAQRRWRKDSDIDAENAAACRGISRHSSAMHTNTNTDTNTNTNTITITNTTADASARQTAEASPAVKRAYGAEANKRKKEKTEGATFNVDEFLERALNATYGEKGDK